MAIGSLIIHSHPGGCKRRISPGTALEAVTRALAELPTSVSICTTAAAIILHNGVCFFYVAKLVIRIESSVGEKCGARHVRVAKEEIIDVCIFLAATTQQSNAF